MEKPEGERMEKPEQVYPFALLDSEREPPPLEVWVETRPIVSYREDLEEGASHYVPGKALENAVNVAIALGDPLLLTGAAGTGKTQLAYYIAWRLGLGKVLHFQVKSTSSARDLLYRFDTVGYFRDAHIAREGCDGKPLDKKKYREKGPLWEALEASGAPRVLLLDEIDKAPKDFPNDLLHELDQMQFEVPDTDEQVLVKTKKLRPIVVVTSNSERRLPEPFLRRCVYHDIRFNNDLLWQIVRRRCNGYANLSEEILRLALDRFLQLRMRNLRKKPSTSEMLNWLRVISLTAEADAPRLQSRDLQRLPHLGVLVKDHQDLIDILGDE